MADTSKPKALVITTVPPDLRTMIAQRCEVVDRESLAGWPATKAPGFAVIATTAMAGVDAATLDALPDAKIVISNGAGLDKMDLAAARARGVAVCNTPDEMADDVGEAVIALTYGVLRKVVAADRFVRDGKWGKDRPAVSTRVSGKTIGIVGLGRIGKRAAKIAEGIGMKVLYLGRKKQPDVSYTFVPDLLTLAEQSDVLVLSCPATPETAKLVNAAVLERLGPNGVLINVSRGLVVDEPALLDALEKGTIAGAGLDVFNNEPKIDARWLKLDNVVLQPHSTSITHETRAAMIARLSRDLDAFIAGKPHHDAARG